MMKLSVWTIVAVAIMVTSVTAFPLSPRGPGSGHPKLQGVEDREFVIAFFAAIGVIILIRM